MTIEEVKECPRCGFAMKLVEGRIDLYECNNCPTKLQKIPLLALAQLSESLTKADVK